MKVVLYMAISVDGYIAKADDEVTWSDAEWQNYKSMVQEAGNLIIGRKTYDIFMEDGGFGELGNPKVLVVSSKRKVSEDSNVIWVNSFEEALEKLENMNMGMVLVGGGANLNRLALESGKIDEIYLDVEPVLYGKGISLFDPIVKEVSVELLEVNKYGGGGVQLHYKVKKD